MNTYTEKGNTVQEEQKLILSDRKQLAVSGVTDVLRFDETTAVFDTVRGRLTVKGENLRVEIMDVEAGNVTLKGTIGALVYAGDSAKKSGFFSKLAR